MCGGGGPCPVARGGACDAIMSCIAIAIIFFIFRASGVLDKIFYGLGYAKAKPTAHTRFVPTPGDITECSRNDTEGTTDSTIYQLIDYVDKYGNLFDKYGNLIDKYGNPLDHIFQLPNKLSETNDTEPDLITDGTTNPTTAILYYLV
uniref:Uncharacterized protein n=1 Tax=Heliothis virescens TaxID=7102 RepID=A0A2A4J587_HELVI